MTNLCLLLFFAGLLAVPEGAISADPCPMPRANRSTMILAQTQGMDRRDDRRDDRQENRGDRRDDRQENRGDRQDDRHDRRDGDDDDQQADSPDGNASQGTGGAGGE